MEYPIAEIKTPAALVDLDRLERNASRMRDRAGAWGVRLRPHIKTHKSVDAARVQVGDGTGGITVSTYAEAAGFAREGFRDITWAVPLSPGRMPDAVALAHRVDHLRLVVDHESSVSALEAEAASSDMALEVMLKLDCGNHRAGVDPRSDEALWLARRIASSSTLRFRGVLAHAGHAYAATRRGEVKAIAAQERDETVSFAKRLRAIGVMVEEVSIGSTPTMTAIDSVRDVTEIRPGNYAFFDVFQATLGSCSLQDIALRVSATVVGIYPDRDTFIIDAGALALSKDPGPFQMDPNCGYGVLYFPNDPIGSPPLRVGSLTQEHGVVSGLHRAPGVHVGTRVEVLPNHSCLTAACFDRYHVIRHGKIIDEWPLVRGWNV